MDRRTFVALTAGSTLGVPAVVHAEDEMDNESDCDETVTVQTTSTGRTAEWPKPWHDHSEHVSAVNAEIAEEYRDESWYSGSGITSAADAEICGRSELVVKVRASDVEAAESRIGNERDGVRIRIEEGEPPEPLGLDGDERGGGETGSTTGNADDGLPGFTLPGALAGLLGAGYLRSRRNADR